MSYGFAQKISRHPERFGKGEASEQPVFIVGMPRSGTSLVENILASHSQVFGADELTDIEAISNAIQKYSASGNPYPTALRDVPDAVIKEFAQRYLERLRDLAPTAQRIVNKMPTNFEHLGLIALMLPNARIIHCKRDRIDTCLSCYFQNFSHRQLDFSYDLFHLRFFWDCYKRLMEHWVNVLPIQIFEITYEQLVVNQETQTRELLEFCGLNWEPECAAPHLNQRPVQTASRWQVRQPVYTSSIGRWRNYEKHIAPLTDGPSFVAEKF